MDDRLQEQLRILQQEYIRQLPARMDALKSLADANPAQRTELQREAHQLAGTAQSYGFPEITTAARALEERLIDHPGATITTYMDALLDACKKAQWQADEAIQTDEHAADATRKPRILLVDDDPLIHRFLQKRLQQDAEIVTATSATGALQLLSEQMPDLLICDQHLEGDTTGLEWLAQIRAQTQWKTLPAILLSATHTAEMHQQAEAAGVAISIAKPIDPVHGIALIRRYIPKA